MNTKQIRNVDISGIQHLPMIDFIGNDFAIFDDIRDIPFTPYPTRLLSECGLSCSLPERPVQDEYQSAGV